MPRLVTKGVEDALTDVIRSFLEDVEEHYVHRLWSYDDANDLILSPSLRDKISHIQKKIDALQGRLDQGALTEPDLHEMKVSANEINNAIHALTADILPFDYFTSSIRAQELDKLLKQLRDFIDTQNTDVTACLSQKKPTDKTHASFSRMISSFLIQKKYEKAKTLRAATFQKIHGDHLEKEKLTNISSTEIACFGSNRGGYGALRHYHQTRNPHCITFHFGDEECLLKELVIFQRQIYSAEVQSESSRLREDSNPSINRWHSKSMIMALLIENLYRYYSNQPLIMTEFILERCWPCGSYKLLDANAYQSAHVQKEQYVTSAELRMIYRLMHEINAPIVNEIMKATTRFVTVESNAEGDSKGDGFIIRRVETCAAPWDGEDHQKRWQQRVSAGGPIEHRGYYRNLSKDWMNGLMHYQEILIDLKASSTSQHRTPLFNREAVCCKTLPIDYISADIAKQLYQEQTDSPKF